MEEGATYPLENAGWKTILVPFSGDKLIFGGMSMLKTCHRWSLA